MISWLRRLFRPVPPPPLTVQLKDPREAFRFTIGQCHSIPTEVELSFLGVPVAKGRVRGQLTVVGVDYEQGVVRLR